MSYEFEKVEGGVVFGKDLVTNEANIRPGLLVVMDSGGDGVGLCGADSKPDGFAYGAREKVYNPTTKVYASGEEVNLIMGDGMALLSVDFFSSGSLPSIQADLYAGASGKIATSGSYKFGKCRQQVTSYPGTGGVPRTGTSLALISFDFNAFN